MKINKQRMNRDSRFENIKMIKHNRDLHARLRQDRKMSVLIIIYLLFTCDMMNSH